MTVAEGPNSRPVSSVVFGYVTDGAMDPAGAADAVVVTSGERPEMLWKLRLGPVTGCLFGGGPMEVVPHHLSPGDGLAVGYVRDGEVTVEQAGRRITLGPRQAVIYNVAMPFRVSARSHHSYLVVRVPNHRLRALDLDSDHAFATDLTPYPSTSVLAALLETVIDLYDPPAAPAAQHLGDAVMDCVHAVLAEHHHSVVGPPEMLLFNRLTEWLEDHIHESALSGDMLAASQFLSPRYVRKIFAEHGTTVTEFLRRRRLEAVRNDLLDPRHARVKVSAIAARWGFRDPSVFSRAFTREYGESPQRFRSRHAQRQDPTTTDA